MTNLFISFEEGALSVNAAQVKYVRSKLVSSEVIDTKTERWYRHEIYLAGEEEPLITHSEKWWESELTSAEEYSNEFALEDEYSILSHLAKICESLEAVEKLAISQMPREEPEMPPRQTPLEDPED